MKGCFKTANSWCIYTENNEGQWTLKETRCISLFWRGVAEKLGPSFTIALCHYMLLSLSVLQVHWFYSWVWKLKKRCSACTFISFSQYKLQNADLGNLTTISRFWSIHWDFHHSVARILWIVSFLYSLYALLSKQVQEPDLPGTYLLR